MALVKLPPHYPCTAQMACLIREVGATANRTIHIALLCSLTHTEERLAIPCHYLQERHTMGIMLNLTHNTLSRNNYSATRLWLSLDKARYAVPPPIVTAWVLVKGKSNHNSITTWFTCAVTIVDAMPR